MRNSIELKEEDSEDATGSGYRLKAKISMLCRYARFFWPYFRLLTLLIIYILVGAAYFCYHESAFEVESKAQAISEFSSHQSNFYDKIWTLTYSNENDSTIFRNKFNEINQELIDDLSIQISRYQSYQLVTENHLKNESNNDSELLWSYSNSIFFATTIMTTIGYGNKQAPATFYGKIGCLIFALFGIPLFYVTAERLGWLFERFLRWTYHEVREIKEKIFLVAEKQFRRIFLKNKIQLSSINNDNAESVRVMIFSMNRATALSLLFVIIIYITITGLALKALKGWSFLDSCYNSFNTITTIGYGNNVPSKTDNTFLIVLYMIFGIAITKLYFQLVALLFSRNLNYRLSKFYDFLETMRQKNASGSVEAASA